MTRHLGLLSCLCFVLAAPAAVAQAPMGLPAVQVQPQKIMRERSFVRFVSKQMNVPVEGQFRKFDGTITFDPIRPGATKAEFTVDLGSIDLNSEEGETEVKRPLWLNVAAFPTARFVATSVKELGKNRYDARGPLTIKGVTADVATTFTLTESGNTRTVEGEFPIRRLRYRVGEGQWADTDTVADEILVRYRFTIRFY